ncbi:hypothetical protein H5410_003314 [Solanum commersonii]|uniref:Uncharacterized protein n=1 Tax=Solanum commersonii TaxID=4109 RepID=A0A9J6B4C2_SOLCO|nr:hypothetical protein H5410_003314 [Solanum commersonii]
MGVYARCECKAVMTWKSGSPIHSAIRLLVNFIAFLLYPSGSSRFESLGNIILFIELLGDTPIAPFHLQLDLSLKGSAHWNKRQSPGRSGTHQLGSAILRPSFLRSFQPLCSFLPSNVHALPKTLNS